VRARVGHDAERAVLREDLLAVDRQGRAIPHGSRYVLHGREEDSTLHGEVGLRHFYAEWRKRLGCLASDPSRNTPAGDPARA